MIQHLGPARFGLLTLIWAVVTYFGLFDFGLGRALTIELAGVFAKKEHHKVGPLVGTSTALMASLGLAAGLLMAATASWGVGLIHAVPDRHEAIRAVYAMACAMPFMLLTAGFRGILEARHAFGVVNLIRLPMGLFTFLGPLMVVLYSQTPGLDSIAWVLVAGRVMSCAAHAYYAWHGLPRDRSPLNWQAGLLRPLFISGGWMTVSNVISPFMGYVDRFVIGALVSASAVAYYATPQELVTKLWVIPGALTAVLFPAFAAQMARADEQTWALFKKAVHWLFLALLPVTVALTLFAHQLLVIWINPVFADHCALLLQIFSIGILINCLAHIPFTLIQSAGAARLTALVHLVELPIFLLILWWLTSTHGTIGAAIAWLIRMILDTSLMFTMCSSYLRRPVRNLLSYKVLMLMLLTVIGFSGGLIQSLTVRICWMIFITGISICLLLISWKAENPNDGLLNLGSMFKYIKK